MSRKPSAKMKSLSKGGQTAGGGVKSFHTAATTGPKAHNPRIASLQDTGGAEFYGQHTAPRPGKAPIAVADGTKTAMETGAKGPAGVANARQDIGSFEFAIVPPLGVTVDPQVGAGAPDMDDVPGLDREFYGLLAVPQKQFTGRGPIATTGTMKPGNTKNSFEVQGVPGLPEEMFWVTDEKHSTDPDKEWLVNRQGAFGGPKGFAGSKGFPGASANEGKDRHKVPKSAGKSAYPSAGNLAKRGADPANKTPKKGK